MYQTKRRSSSSSPRSSSWRIWMFFLWRYSQSILSFPLFVKVRLSQTINYLTPSRFSTRSTCACHSRTCICGVPSPSSSTSTGLTGRNRARNQVQKCPLITTSPKSKSHHHSDSINFSPDNNTKAPCPGSESVTPITSDNTTTTNNESEPETTKASFTIKDNNSNSNSNRSSSRKRFYCFQIRNIKYKNTLGKMTQFLSRTMALFSIVFVVHFIIMTTLAEKGALEEFPSLSTSMRRHRRDFGFDEPRRQPRSYRSDKDPSKSAATGNIVAPLAVARPPDKADALFATENSTVVTAQIGSTANLPCIVKNLGNGVASWIRRHDYHLLTVGMGTYSNDDRFYVSHNRPNQNWELHLKFVKPSDEGIYECQISTHPPSSIFIVLRVVEAKAEILGEPDKHVRSGSTIELVCVLRDSTEPPVYVFWYHNDRMINYDNERGVVVSSDVEKSILRIQEAHKSDSGNYTCQPSNASPSWIVVHILNGEKPAAMHHGSVSAGVKCQSSSSPTSLIFVISLLSFLVTTWLSCNYNMSTKAHPQNPHQSQQNYHEHHHHRYQCHDHDGSGGRPQTRRQQIQKQIKGKKNKKTTTTMELEEKARIQIMKPEPTESQSESPKETSRFSTCTSTKPKVEEMSARISSRELETSSVESGCTPSTHSENTDSHNFGFGERQRIFPRLESFPPYTGGPTATTFPISSTKVTSLGCSVASLDADLNSSCFPQLSSSSTDTTLVPDFPTTSTSSNDGMGKEARGDISFSSRSRNCTNSTYSYQNFTSVVSSTVER